MILENSTEIYDLAKKLIDLDKYKHTFTSRDDKLHIVYSTYRDLLHIFWIDKMLYTRKNGRINKSILEHRQVFNSMYGHAVIVDYNSQNIWLTKLKEEVKKRKL